MNFIDICSGIGGFRTGLERNGHNCIAFAEIDKYAIQSYKAIYDTENEVELGDITTMHDSEWEQFKGNCDMIVGGTPCQSFSIAGKRLGFEDTRGTVFFSYVNAIKQVQPKYFLFENVKGLISHDKGNTIKVILKAFDEVGYDLDFEIFNSKYYGVPQNRERIYIVGIRKDLSDKPFKPVQIGKKKMELLKAWAKDEVSLKQIHPKLQTEVTTRLIDVLENEVDEKYYLSEEKTKKLTLNEDLSGRFNHYDYRDVDSIHSTEKVSPTLNTMQGGDRQPKVAVLGNSSNTGHRSQDIHDTDGISPTIAARDYKGAKQIAVREATKQGYAVAEQGDSVNVSYPTSKTRRGRVGKQVAQTLQAGEVNQGVVINPLKDKTDYGWHFEQAVYDSQGITRTVKANGGSGNIPKTIEGLRIRKLTPLECWRLQGFTDEQFYKAKNSGVSNSQLYKQAGNSVTVNVVDEIVKGLK
ncbi:DNA (cytosine-5-)-methyltransferase [Staphylococcus saprophyticus]|nr:DNA (cytosine-5-)-methyltransferase [Staphylococcus saprophyticus]TFV23367.1 DNA (cytosine-5-)-methyltransferase [Staphylococcus saprophyticus]